MSTAAPHAISHPYAAPGQHWLCITLPDTGEGAPLETTLHTRGWKRLPHDPQCYVLAVSEHWEEDWRRVYESISVHHLGIVKVALLASDTIPGPREIDLVSQPASVLNQVAESLWLIEALGTNPIECYFQSLVDRRGQLFGYEAFARIRNHQGEVMSGGAIINASHVLNVQHVLDRHLHTEAVRAFTSAKLTGNLCVNFIPGYIRKISAYLEGLCEAVKVNDLAAGRIVLDITDVENIHDYAHLSNIISYCHGKGFKVAIDGITSAASAVALIEKLRPDIAAIDTSLIRKMTRIAGSDALDKLVALAHRNQCEILVKRVETDEIFATLTSAGADYFQGYLFSRPMPADKIQQHTS
ncbi:MAG: EAL domain-containing protein [Alphaproteobacteria bacterium]|nr:EAL domain-containing protein [Alphaproteobacteria bacterium]